jgi:hypothetical protein
MKTRIMLLTIVLLLSAFTGSVYGEFEGSSNTFLGTGAGSGSGDDDDYATFIGYQAGYNNNDGTESYHGKRNTFVGVQSGYSNTTGYQNTFVGDVAGRGNTTGSGNNFLGHQAGYTHTTGWENSFIGSRAGYSNIVGIHNTFVGVYSGYSNATGSDNVFLGYRAGYHETGSNRLYIHNSEATTPLIYGEFNNRILTINGNLEVIGPDNGLVYLSDNTTDNTTKVSRMVLNHYSNAAAPVYLFGAASTATNNFVAFGGGNTIGNAATQLDFFTAENPTTLVGTPRLTIIGNGYVGIGIQDPVYPLEMAGGAYSNGGSWIDGSSREYKDDIERLTSEEAFDALEGLDPVKYAYKKDRTEKRVGFIAEDVPGLVATKGRKGLSPMDIVAVLTKVVQEQQKTNQEQHTVIKTLAEKLAQLEAKIEDLQAKGGTFPILSQK